MFRGLAHRLPSTLIVFLLILLLPACTAAPAADLTTPPAVTGDALRPVTVTPLPPPDPYPAYPGGYPGYDDAYGPAYVPPPDSYPWPPPPGYPGYDAYAGEPYYGEAPVDTSDWLVYAQPEHRFRIAYAPAFPIEELDADARAAFSPIPLLAVNFWNPDKPPDAITAALPELALRVYHKDSHLPLEAWLESVDLYQPDRVWGIVYLPRGVAIFRHATAAPTDFVYFEDDMLVYELVPAGHDGGAMVASFEVTGR